MMTVLPRSSLTAPTAGEQSAHPRTLVMGILNVTEDSFSDGGQWLPTDLHDPTVAVAHAREMVAAGADMVDIGGESTRPGAVRVDEATELSRVIPIVEALAGEGIYLSVDTMRASVARSAIEAGAHLINDVSGGLADNAMLSVAAETGAALCLMHWETDRFGDADANGVAGATQGRDRGPEFVQAVADFLARRAEAAIAAGVREEAIVIDPGLGFAKSADGNWSLLHYMDKLTALGFPVLIGASRKRFLTTLLPDQDGTPCLPAEADAATAAISALAAAQGAWAVRVHDVRPSADAVRVAQAWSAAAGPAIPEGWRARRG